MPTQPAFLVLNSATDTDATGDGTGLTVDFDTEVFDQGADFTADTFTAPVGGRYLLTTIVKFGDTEGTEALVWIITSNRQHQGMMVNAEGCDTAGNYLAIHVTTIADMDANDTATVYVEVGGGAKNVDIVGDATPKTHFSGALLC